MCRICQYGIRLDRILFIVPNRLSGAGSPVVVFSLNFAFVQ